MYKPELIVEEFMREELEKSRREIVPFVAGHEDTVKVWATHFRGIFNGVQLKWKTPYVVTQKGRGGVKTLWKENMTKGF